MNEELVVKCTEMSNSVFLRVYFEDGEPVGCEYYNETPGYLTYMKTVEIPQAIQDALIEHWYETIMQKHRDYHIEWRERRAEEKAGV